MATISSHLFQRTDRDRDEQEQLLKLFWNRAELKKEFDKLRADAAQLSEQLSRQEARTLRVQQRFDELEAHLANPETAHRAVAYYQLRAIWNGCHQRIASLAKDLERTCRDREYREHVATFRSSVNASLVGLQQEAAAIEAREQELAEEVKVLRDRRTRKFGAWNYFSRRRLTAEIHGLRLERKLVSSRLRELHDEIRRRIEQDPPPFAGVSVEARRLINLRIVAYAQELCLHFASDDLANLAREAAARRLAEVRYGNRRDCRTLSHTAEVAAQALESDSACLDRVRLRARYLQSHCEYRSDTDTVPSAASLGGIVMLDKQGRKTGQSSSVNVLVDEYWEIFSVLFD